MRRNGAVTVIIVDTNILRGSPYLKSPGWAVHSTGVLPVIGTKVITKRPAVSSPLCVAPRPTARTMLT
jgi:hypothetical protein